MPTIVTHDGDLIDPVEYNKSLREERITFRPFMDQYGESALMGATYRHQPCGCKIDGCGTLQFPLTIKFCEIHAAVKVEG